MTTRKPLTHARQADTAKPEEKPYKLSAGEGLFLEINPNGSKRWRLRYFFTGKEKMLSLGLYPTTTLLEAKEARDQAKKLIAQGIDPSQKRKEEKIATKIQIDNTFKLIAYEWLSRQTDKAEVTRKKSAWLLQFAIDDFGDLAISEITPPMVLAACRKAEKEGKLETAKRIRTKCGQVFRYAVAIGKAERDPTSDLRGILTPPSVTHRAAITDPKKVGQLLKDIDNYKGQFVTVCALKLAPLVFIRPGELRSAKWIDIDLEQKVWSYTPSKTRNQTQLNHIIPLSKQAVTILQTLQPITGNSPFVFQSIGKEGYLSEAAVLNALRRMGYSKEEMSGHLTSTKKH